MYLDMDVYRGNRLLGCFKTRDISFDGMDLETDGTLFNPNEIIAVRLLLNEPTPLLRSIVTHASANDVGIAMIDFSKAIYYSIYTLYKQQLIPLKQSLIGIESYGKRNRGFQQLKTRQAPY